MGFDTDIRDCHISHNCHIIHDLYKLSDDCTKLNKTDMKIFRRSSEKAKDDKAPDKVPAPPEYTSRIENLKEYISTSKKNIFTLFILLTLPTDHNILKIFGKDVLMGFKAVPRAVGKTLVATGKTLAVTTGAAAGVVAGAVVGIGTGLKSGVQAGIEAGLKTTATVTKTVYKSVKGGKKRRTKKKTRVNKSRRYIRRSRKL